MNKLVMTVSLAMSLGMASASAVADDGNFFVNADAGQANYRVQSSYRESFLGGAGYNYNSSTDKRHVAGALRFGYRWHSVVDYGVEAGYVDLGQTTTRGRFNSAPSYVVNSLQVRGVLLGGNLKYNIADNWYVSARGGWFRSKNELYESPGFSVCPLIVPGGGCPKLHTSSTGTGEYLGAGMGYNISPHFSVGLSYDNYHARRDFSDEGSGPNIALYSVSAEYRF